MKLDKIKFANLCSTISIWLNDRKQLLSCYDIEELDRIIDVDPAKAVISDVDELLKQIKLHSSFIPAIKAYRAITGCDLKTAKEAIEKYR